MTEQDWHDAQDREHRDGPWSHTDLLLAAVHDAIERLTFVQLRKAGSKVPAPKPIPRPGTRASVTPINPAAKAYLERLRDQHRRQEGA